MYFQACDDSDVLALVTFDSFDLDLGSSFLLRIACFGQDSLCLLFRSILGCALTDG